MVKKINKKNRLGGLKFFLFSCITSLIKFQWDFTKQPNSRLDSGKIMQEFTFGAGTDVGRVRSHNEDCFRSEPQLGLWIVADGMGGHEGGEIASEIASDAIVERILEGKSLKKSIEEAHHAVLQATREGKGPQGMGTTVVVIRLIDHQYEIAWVGDCRAYLWDQKTLHLLTKDHSYVQYLVDEGIIKAEDMENHAHQNFIMQALGSTEMENVNVDLIQNVLYRGEQILLCSDGLNKEMTDPDIADFLTKKASDQEMVELLIQTSVKNGGRDNITVALVSAPPDAPVRVFKNGRLNLLAAKLQKILGSIVNFFKE